MSNFTLLTYEIDSIGIVAKGKELSLANRSGEAKIYTLSLDTQTQRSM